MQELEEAALMVVKEQNQIRACLEKKSAELDVIRTEYETKKKEVSPVTALLASMAAVPKPLGTACIQFKSQHHARGLFCGKLQFLQLICRNVFLPSVLQTGI